MAHYRYSEADLAALPGNRGLPVAQGASRSTPRPRKYRNRRTQGVNGLWFDSIQEAHRAQELWLMAKAGIITDLELDKRRLRYPLLVNGVKIATYIADFRYVENGVLIVEDSKGYRTPIYRMKSLLMQALYHINIRET